MSTFFQMMPSSNTTFDVMDDFFNTFGTPTRTTFGTQTNTTTNPRANVTQTENGYTISLAVPGFTREQFDVSLNSNTLTVSLDEITVNTDSNYIRQEFSYGTFTRTWTLPKNVDTDDMTATYTAGILTLSIPTTERNTSYKITVD